MRTRRIESKYEGTCWRCGWHWDVGDYIYWSKEEGAVCEGCGITDEEYEHARDKVREGQKRDSDSKAAEEKSKGDVH